MGREVDDFDSIKEGDQVQITSAEVECGPVVVTVKEKIVDRADHVMGWATDDLMVTVRRSNFIRICGKVE